MTKFAPKIFVLILILTTISCKKELEPDYKVIELEYGFDNYFKNVRDNSEEIIIKQRNIVMIDVDEDGITKIEKNVVSDSLIVTELKKYIIPSPDNDQMPKTIEKEFEYSGKVHVNKNIIILGTFDKKLNYEKYREIRNKIYIAHNEVRNEFSRTKFNKTILDIILSTGEEDVIKWEEIRQIFPIRYMEMVE